MGFMEMIKSWMSPAGAAGRPGGRTYVVDAARLVDEKTGRRMAPREQVQMFNALAKVAKQENLALQAVFESDRPLREVEDGGDYNGVQVYFAPDGEQLVALAIKLCRKSGAMLITSGVTMESKATEAGIPVLCSGTFRKTFLQGAMPAGSGERGDRGGRGDRGDRGDRGGDRRRGREPRRERGGGKGSAPKASEAAGEGEAKPEAEAPAEDAGDEGSAVRNLIDLVE